MWADMFEFVEFLKNCFPVDVKFMIDWKRFFYGQFC